MYAKGELSADEVEEMSRNARERFQAIIDKGTPAHLIQTVLTSGQVLIGEPPGEAGRGATRLDKHGKPLGFDLKKVLGLEDSPATYNFHRKTVKDCATDIEWGVNYADQLDAAKENTVKAALERLPIYYLYVNQWPIRAMLKGHCQSNKGRNIDLVKQMVEEGAPEAQRGNVKPIRQVRSAPVQQARIGNTTSSRKTGKALGSTSRRSGATGAEDTHNAAHDFDEVPDPESSSSEDEDEDEDKDEDEDPDDDEEAAPVNRKRGSGNPNRNIPGVKQLQGKKLQASTVAGPSKPKKRSNTAPTPKPPTKKSKKSNTTSRNAVDNTTAEPAPLTMAQQKALARSKAKGKARAE
ncbi:hypothetical protein ACGC1H_004923 [Rhizoctonia solani]